MGRGPTFFAAPVSGGLPIAPNAISGLKLWLDAQAGGFDKSSAARFISGSSSHLSKTSSADVQTGDIDFTFAFWVKLDTLSGDRQFVSKDSASGREYYCMFRSGVGGGFRGTVFRGGADQIALSAFTPTIDTWYFVCFWHDATANTVNISVNNGTTVSTAIAGALDAVTATDFNIGRRVYSGFQEHLSGAMQNVGFWKRTLTPTERTSLYNSAAGKNYSDLTSGEKTSMVSWWSLNETTGSRSDSHGTATLTNNTVFHSAGKVLSASGACINNWPDQGPLSTHFTASLGGAKLLTGVSGIGGLNEIEFAQSGGSGDVLKSTSAASAQKPVTYAFVARIAGSGERCMVGPTSGSTGVAISFGAGNAWQIIVNGAGAGATISTVAGVYFVGLVTWESGSNIVRYYTNGVADGTNTTAATPSASFLQLGANYSSSSVLFFGGALVELVKYDSVLSYADRAGLIYYLGDKYGLTVTP